MTSPGSRATSVGPRRSPLALPARALVATLRFYQRFVSPLFPPSCRFYPTCSSYAIEALRVHGLLRGSALTLVRLAKCAPWHPGGLDPVPPRGRPPAARGAGAGPVTEERATS